MALKRFEEYARDYLNKDIEPALKNLKSVKTTSSTKKNLNENSFLVGNDYKVKVVVDVPQSLVKEYIDKVKSETDKNPLDNFSESEIAEQMISFIVKKNLMIDNLSADFTVGTENLGSSEKSKESTTSDAEELSNDLGAEDNESENDNSDGEIEFNDFNNPEETIDNIDTNNDEEDGEEEIEFDDSETKEKDLGEEREVDETDSDPDSNFEEIEFDDTSKSKTIGDLKKSQNTKIENKHKEETQQSSNEEEEENIEDMYKKIGYKVGYFENLDFSKLRKYN